MENPTNKSPNNIAISLGTATYNLFGRQFGTGVLNAISKEEKAPSGTPRSGAARTGVVKHPHPVSMDSVYALKDISGHHSSCIQAKKYATVGLGFIDEGDEVSKTKDPEQAVQTAQTLLSGRGKVMSKVDKALDRLTNFGFMNELLDACEDYQDVGTGYLEVHRNESGEIDGISHVIARDLWACTHEGRLFYQYQAYGGRTKYWVPFGRANREWLKSETGPFKGSTVREEDISELIVFIKPTNRCKYYGYPDWLSASVDIDLLKKSKQYKADFYHNRGVLDKVLVVTGTQVDSVDWDKVKAALAMSIGEGNNFNSMVFNFASPDAKVAVLNLGTDGSAEQQFALDNEVLTQNIVSSHRVPPLLANILIPGKLGAANETINALVNFQLLVVSPDQNIFEKQLAQTLAGPEGVPGLNAEDFRLRTITSQIDINGMNTVSQMRSEALSGENKGRDVSKGLKK